MRVLIIKKRDAGQALGDALDGQIPCPPEDALVLLAGTFPCSEVEFVGVDAPEAVDVTISGPEPIEGDLEGWLYFDNGRLAAYTEDLIALRLP